MLKSGQCYSLNSVLFRAFFAAAFFLQLFAKPVEHFNECLNRWSERVSPLEMSIVVSSTVAKNNNGDDCDGALDCPPMARCVFSPFAGKHICCGPKSGAFIPKCSFHKRKTAAATKNSSMRIREQQQQEQQFDGQILCTPDSHSYPLNVRGRKRHNSGAEEQCPEGMRCVPSLTDFTKQFDGQPNFVCCTESIST